MSNQRKSETRTQAEKIVWDFGVRTAPVPIDRIAKAQGAEIRFSPLDDELSGMIYIKDGVPIIGVNSLHHPNRQRFTIAHEVAHLVLHKQLISSAVHVDKQYPMLMRGAIAGKGIDRIEIDANNFAAELLIPRYLLDAAMIAQKFDDIDDGSPMELIAKKFRVSRQMLEFRIANLADE